MRILHLSDLHIVAEETRNLADGLNNGLDDLPFKLQLHPAADGSREILLRTIGDRYAGKFDAILVTGDLTGFGDDRSMMEAAAYLEQIAEVALTTKDYKKVIVIPGNHDVLEFTLTAFINAVENKVGVATALLFRWFGGDAARLAERLKKLLTQLRPDRAFPIGVAEVEDFAAYLRAGFNMKLSKFTLPDMVGPTTVNVEGKAEDGREMRVRFALINTLTFTPFLFSSGMINELEAAFLSLRLEKEANSATVALTHQGFLPLPSLFAKGSDRAPRDIALIFEHSLASLVNGYNLARVLQSNNVELHLHGHEHYHTASSFDFELDKPGALYSFGSAAAGNIEGAEFGFNILRFEAPSVVQIESQQFRQVKATFEPSGRHFVKLGDQVPERLTRLARSELHRVFYTTADPANVMEATMSKETYKKACDDLFETSDKRLLYFGVQLKSARDAIERCLYDGTHEKQRRYIKRLKEGVDFLITGSTYLYTGRREPDDAEKASAAIALAHEWQSFFEEIASSMQMTQAELRQLIQVKKTSAPLSHGGVIEYSFEGGHYRFHRALVQTVKFQKVVDDELYFEVRDNITSGFLKYYAGTALNLWLRGSKVLEVVDAI